MIVLPLETKYSCFVRTLAETRTAPCVRAATRWPKACARRGVPARVTLLTRSCAAACDAYGCGRAMWRACGSRGVAGQKTCGVHAQQIGVVSAVRVPRLCSRHTCNIARGVAGTMRAVHGAPVKVPTVAAMAICEVCFDTQHKIEGRAIAQQQCRYAGSYSCVNFGVVFKLEGGHGPRKRSSPAQNFELARPSLQTRRSITSITRYVVANVFFAAASGLDDALDPNLLMLCTMQ